MKRKSHLVSRYLVPFQEKVKSLWEMNNLSSNSLFLLLCQSRDKGMERRETAGRDGRMNGRMDGWMEGLQRNV